MNSRGIKVWLVHRADDSAILVVPPVKVRTEAQHSILLSLRDLLWENFTFTLTSSVSSLLIIYKYEDKVHIIYTHTQFYTELIKPTLLLHRLPVLDTLCSLCNINNKI